MSAQGPTHPYTNQSLIGVFVMFVCCLVVAFVTAFFIVLGVDLGHLDCGNYCVSSVAPYHSKDTLAQVVYWLFVVLGALPLALRVRGIPLASRRKAKILLVVSVILSAIATALIYSFMFSPRGGA